MHLSMPCHHVRDNDDVLNTSFHEHKVMCNGNSTCKQVKKHHHASLSTVMRKVRKCVIGVHRNPMNAHTLVCFACATLPELLRMEKHWALSDLRYMHHSNTLKKIVLFSMASIILTLFYTLIVPYSKCALHLNRASHCF